MDLPFILSLSILAPATFGAFRFRQATLSYRIFIVLLWVGMLAELISFILIKAIKNNALSSNIYNLIEFGMLMSTFFYWDLFKKRNDLFALLLILGFVLWIADVFVLGTIFDFNPYFAIYYCLVIDLCAITVLNKLIVTEKGDIISSPRFLICIGLVIFFSYRLLMELADMPLIRVSDEFFDNAFSITIYVNLLVNLIYAIAILCLKKVQDPYNFILVAAIVLGIVILYFIVSIILQQRRTLRLHQERILAEITTLENERRRIASDLHDEVGPLLSAIKLQINSIESHDAEDQHLISRSSGQIDEIIARMREISNNLMPNTLIRKGLISALDEFIAVINKTTTLRINFTAESPIAANKEMEINIYRMMQEIIHNTVKHAKATQLNIRLFTRDGYIVLITEDNGIGFNFDSRLRENSGLGLRNLSSRTEVMGGDFKFQSAPGKGTKYVFEIPVQGVNDQRRTAHIN